jgi:hypothetical protein
VKQLMLLGNSWRNSSSNTHIYNLRTSCLSEREKMLQTRSLAPIPEAQATTSQGINQSG